MLGVECKKQLAVRVFLSHSVRSYDIRLRLGVLAHTSIEVPK